MNIASPADAMKPAVDSEIVRLRAQLRARDAYLLELERALEEQNRQLSAAGLDGADGVAAVQGRLRGQAYRIAELESELRRVATRPLERLAAVSGERERHATSELRRVRGIGPRFAKQLSAAGITTIAQVARWTEQDIARVAEQLHIATARIQREAWVEQARALLAPTPIEAYDATSH